jgi:hypothetical protein
MMLTALVGCSGPARPASTAVPESDACITGLLRSTGTEGFAELVLREDDGVSTILAGAARDLLLRLTGAVVTACGPVVADARRPERRVEEWTLRSVDGQEAHLGRLVRGGDGFVLEPTEGEGVPVAVAAVPHALQALVGRTVWVAGRWSGTVFHVGSFGLLR